MLIPIFNYRRTFLAYKSVQPDKLKKKTKNVIAITIAITIIGIVVSFGLAYKQEIVIEHQPAILTPDGMTTNPIELRDISQKELQMYRFNTQCELLYGMVYNQYPNGDTLPSLVLSSLVQKYRADYSQWEDILFDDEKRLGYFENGMPVEFAQVFAQSVSKEYSINPTLHTTVMTGFLLAGEEVHERLFKENNCNDYFIERNQ